MLSRFCEWLVLTPVSLWIASVSWVVPTVQIVHILAISVVMSSVLLFDLRVLGVAGGDMSVPSSARRHLPWIWGGVVVLAISGSILIVGEPARELLNWTFQLKMALLAAVLLITAAVQTVLRVEAPSMGRAKAARLAAVLSLALWVGIVVCGRLIAYTTPH